MASRARAAARALDRVARRRGAASDARADAPSATYAEAQRRGRAFYRDCCREVRAALDAYALREVTTETRVRRALKDVVRASGDAVERASRDDGVKAALLDRARARGREELAALEAHHYQRHHLITTFVRGARDDATRDDATRDAFVREFLDGARARAR